MKKVFLIFVIAVLMFLLAFLLAGCETSKFDAARFSSRKWTEVAAFEQVEPGKVEPGEPIQFLRPIRGTFKVVWVDLSYQNAIVTTEDQTKAYLLTHLPRLPEWRKRNLSSLAHERGYR